MKRGAKQLYVVYVYLLDEGTDVWRPVQAEHIGEDRYRIVTQNTGPEDEAWEFPSGSIVRCRVRDLSGGTKLVACELA